MILVDDKFLLEQALYFSVCIGLWWVNLDKTEAMWYREGVHVSNLKLYSQLNKKPSLLCLLQELKLCIPPFLYQFDFWDFTRTYREFQCGTEEDTHL